MIEFSLPSFLNMSSATLYYSIMIEFSLIILTMFYPSLNDWLASLPVGRGEVD